MRATRISESNAWREVDRLARLVLGGSTPTVTACNQLVRLAEEMMAQLAAGLHVNPRRANPPLLILNPPRGRSDWSNAVEEIRYRHAHDGKYYKHPFEKGVALRGNPDGTATLYRPDGRPVWEQF